MVIDETERARQLREWRGVLDDDDLETILIVARNGQSGRITEREIRLLVEAYRKQR